MWGNRGKRIVRKFVRAINDGDEQAIADLLAPDCVVISSQGKAIRGYDACLDGFRAFRAAAPDYTLTIDRIVARGDDLLVAGRGASLREGYGSRSLFRARVNRGRLAWWEVFTMNTTLTGALGHKPSGN